MRHAVGSRPAPDEDEGARGPAAGVEPAVVRQLMDLAGVAFAHEVVALYFVTAAEKVAAVGQGTAAGAPARVLGAAHSLASCAGAVGAAAVEACARVIESEAAAARLPDASALTALEQAVAESRRALEAVLAALVAEGDATDAAAADAVVTTDDATDGNVTADLAGAAAPVLAAP